MCPKVAIVILNWNQKRDTIECLESVTKVDYPLFEIVVVDNGSTDGSPDTISELFPDITLIVNEENLGFTGGNNVGMRYALTQGFDYVCLLNNDTIVDPEFLRLLVEATEGHLEVGVAGPTIFYFDQPTAVWSAGGRFDWRRGEATMLTLDETEGDQHDDVREVDWVTGCAMLMKKAVLEAVGLFDPRYFIYFEEAEWCFRATKTGVKAIHVPAAKLWHKISVDPQVASPRVTYLMVRNHLLFLKTCKVSISTWAYVLANYARMITSYTLRPKHRRERAKRNAMVKGVVDFCRGRWGRPEI